MPSLRRGCYFHGGYTIQNCRLVSSHISLPLVDKQKKIDRRVMEKGPSLFKNKQTTEDSREDDSCHLVDYDSRPATIRESKKLSQDKVLGRGPGNNQIGAFICVALYHSIIKKSKKVNCFWDSLGSCIYDLLCRIYLPHIKWVIGTTSVVIAKRGLPASRR